MILEKKILSGWPMKHLVPLALACIVLLFANVRLEADSNQPAEDKIPIVTGTSYPPYNDQNAPGGGLTVMLMEQVMERAGLETTTTILPWARALRETAQGKFAATYPYIQTPERAHDFLFSTILVKFNRHLLALPDTADQLQDINDLTGTTTCLPVSWAVPSALVPLLEAERLSLQRVRDMPQCLSMLQAGRVDSVIANQELAHSLVIANGADPDRVRPGLKGQPVESMPFRILVSRNWPDASELLQRIDSALESMRGDGSYDQIVADFYASWGRKMEVD